MRLRNKKTGEIIELEKPMSYKLGKEYDTVAEFIEDWEDVPEESKDEIYWYIESDGEIMDERRSWHIGQSDYEWEREKEVMKRVGNLFETKEEAEKAIERLRAWQRIKKDLVSIHWQDEKDGKFSVWGQFYGHMLENDAILNIHRKDLDLLFPGGDE